MINKSISSTTIRGVMRCLTPWLCLTYTVTAQDNVRSSVTDSFAAVSATVILGLQNVSSNTTGELALQDDALIFRQSEGSATKIPIRSIDAVFVSQEDKQVGGTPMALGRAAAPFGGGRVIGLMAHKKYDFLTFEYRDDDGGLHGVICQLSKGQGQAFARNIVTTGANLRQKATHESK